MRAREAKLLLDASEWSGAYYLVGYAVECGLKACLTKVLQPYLMPDREIISDKAFTHDLAKLSQMANLDGTRNRQAQADPAFGVNWNTVRDWNESSRYVTWTETKSKDLYAAVTDANHGVLPWLRTVW